jgi:(R,R)-butanediol dehydrogenase / meso-butanediol dehydrogenase / diacetyl reductase
MRAVVLGSARDLHIVERQIPEPRMGEVLLRVETVGICGTDAAEYDHGPSLFPLTTRHPTTGHLGPLIPGHEFSGRVVALGPGVDRLSVGDLVASAGSTSCGECVFCRSGRPSRCERYWAVGLNRDGALAGYCSAPAVSCVEVASLGLSADTAALAQPMSIAVHAVGRARISGGERCLVIGAGGVGAFVVFAAARAGCEVVATDLDPDRLAIASALGATGILEPGGGTDPELGEVDVVFEITGTESGMRTGIRSLGPAGRLVAVGFQRRPLDVDLAQLTVREQELLGSNGIDPAVDLPQATRLLASRDYPWSDVAPEVIALEEVGSALAAMAAGAPGPIKRLVSPWITETRPSRM